MAKTALRHRRNRGIGPRGLFILLAAGVVVFLAGRQIWPSLPDEVRNAIRTITLVAFWAFFCINLVVLFQCLASRLRGNARELGSNVVLRQPKDEFSCAMVSLTHEWEQNHAKSTQALHADREGGNPEATPRG
jgi:hypothetical protein